MRFYVLVTLSPCQTYMAAIYAHLIRWAFARFYREFAWTYDTVAALVSAGQWRAWALAALPFARGSVLELGSGTGNLQQALASRADHPIAIGLDASPQMLALARAKIERGGATARLVRGDASVLPFPPASFDTLIATFPSEYIAASATLSEARRVLRPGGQIVIILAAQFIGTGIYHELVELLYRITLQRSPRFMPASEPPRSLIGHMLAQAGFAMQERWEVVSGGRARLHLVLGENVCPQLLSKS